MPSATIAVGDAMWALPEELFSAEGAKCIGDQLANLLSAQARIQVFWGGDRTPPPLRLSAIFFAC